MATMGDQVAVLPSIAVGTDAQSGVRPVPNLRKGSLMTRPLSGIGLDRTLTYALSIMYMGNDMRWVPLGSF